MEKMGQAMSRKSSKTFPLLKSYAGYVVILVLLTTIAYGLLYLTYADVKREMLEALNARQAMHAKQAALGIQSFFKGHIELLQYLAENEHIIVLDDTGQRMMREFVSSHGGEVDIISRIDAEGRILYAEPYDPSVIHQPVTAMEYFEEAKRTLKAVVSDAFTSRRGLKNIIIHVPVCDQGEFDGTLGLLLPFDFIASHYIEDIRIGKEGYAWVISRSGVEISCPVPNHVGNSVFDNCREFPDILAMAERMTRGEQGVTTYTFNHVREEVVRETTKHAVFMPIRLGDNFWSIVVATPEDEVMSSLQGFRNRLVLIAVLLMVGMGFFSYLMFRARFAVQEMEHKKKSEEELDRYFQGSLDLLCIADTEGYFKRLNPEWERTLGYALSELEGQSFMDFIHPQDREATLVAVSDLASNKEVANFINRCRCKDGSYRWLEWRSYPSGNRIYAIARDITERKRVEEALRASEERLRLAMEATQQGWFDVNVQTGEVRVSPEYVRIIGYDPAEFKTSLQEWIDSIHPDDRDALLRAFRECVGSGDTRNMEYRRRTKTGEWTWIRSVGKIVGFDSDKKPLRMTGTHADISDRKRAEEALRESQERFQELAELLPETIFEMDISGNLTFVNQKAFDHFGYSLEDLARALNAFEMVVPEDRPRAVENARKVMSGEKIGLNEYKVIRKDGSIFPVIMHSAAKYHDGKPAGIRGIVIDITETKKLEAQLRQAHKMEAIGTLAGGIAHDFNNILAAIIGYTEMAWTNVSESSRSRQYLGQVLKAAHRAKDLVTQILASSRQRQAQERVPVEIVPVIEEAVKLLRASLPATIEIRQDFRSAKGVVLGDPTEIHQVLVNLCTNAAHAMEERGGVLELSLDERIIASETGADHADLEPGHYLRLTVGDTGHGIDPATLERIFDPYFTTKEVGRGSGLGLAVVHGIVKRYGGAITVSSEPGVGTTFHTLFPAIENFASPEADEAEKPIIRGTERILFVDDEETLVEMGKIILEWLGYNVSVTTNSAEALELFVAQPDRFDAVITDYTMPHMTGADLAKEMMRVRPDIPIILCTGFSENITEEKAVEMGVRAFAMKPLNMREIAETIRKVLDKSHASGIC
jgi:PAS domain S-box-containing protein